MPTITTVDASWTPGPDTFTDAEARRVADDVVGGRFAA